MEEWNSEEFAGDGHCLSLSFGNIHANTIHKEQTMTSSKLAIRISSTHVNHHLWNNHGTWWCHYTVHLPDYTKKRVRVSLDTQNPVQAMTLRDRLFEKVSYL
jgi:hypothetical protein